MVLPLVLLAGCSSGSNVSGTVTFPNDAPLSVGRVVFQSDSFVAQGKISSNGSYTVTGLQPGTYAVYVSGAGAVPEGFVPPEDSDDSGYQSFVDDSFTTAESTPLKCEVPQNRRFDFQVKPPQQNPPD